MSNIVWHYTTEDSLRGIIGEWLIHTSPRKPDPGVRPIVWFSSNPDWERTAGKGIVDPITGAHRWATLGEIVQFRGELVRIGASRAIARHDWAALRKKSRMSKPYADRLVRSALERGADPREWFGSFAAVPLSRCTEIQRFTDGEWERIARIVPEGLEIEADIDQFNIAGQLKGDAA